MSDVKRILDAMVALARALPGASEAHLTIGIHGCDGRALHALKAEGARVETHESDDRTHEWDAASLDLNGATINAFSAHRPLSTEAPDSSVVEAALAQAAEALS
jgi:hypothetical protein